tara:strand:+ start:28552 stop:29181 length:630 start_codon:yes stop_codon:yes gene_type:complete
MKKLILTATIIFGFIFGIQAQVGIGNTNPSASLDVNGTVRVTSLPVGTTDLITLAGHTSSRAFNRTNIGANLIIINNSLDTAPVSGSIGDLNLGVHPIEAGTIVDLNLEISSGNSNSNATFIRLHSYNSNINIAGITNGVHGRHFTLFFSETANISLLEDDLAALPQNRILTAATSQLSISGMGFIDLVYDATGGSDSLGRWVIIKFRG